MLRIVLALALLSGVQVFAQVKNPDSLFVVARELAYAKQYKSSEAICKELIHQHPSNPEYKIFLGRVYSWQQNFNGARELLEPLVNTEPANEDALHAIADAELWSGEHAKALAYCNQGLNSDPQSQSLLLKKAKALTHLEKYKEALTTVDVLLQFHPDDPEAKALREEILSKRMKNTVSASYLNITFSNPGASPWHFAYLEYKRDFRKCPVLARVNYGKVFENDAFQWEVDAYPKLAKKTYMYLNTGYSPGPDVFPLFKAGAELYQGLPKAFEVSLGGRLMVFETQNVFIYTGYLGKYYKNWWLAYRPYIVAPEGNTYTTHTASIRRYWGSSDVYVSLHLIYGAAPYMVSFLQDITRTNAQRIGVDGQFRLKKTYFLKLVFMYEYEEYFPEQYHNRYNAQIILSKKF